MTKLLIAAALFLCAAFARADVKYSLHLGPDTFVTGSGYSDIYIDLKPQTDFGTERREKPCQQNMREFQKRCDLINLK